MILSDLSVKRPVLATVISLLLIAIGLAAFQRIPLREYPDINPPIVSVSTRYDGANASIVDVKITEIIEESISGLEGIRTIESSSKDGVSDITVEFKVGRDIDAARNDVADRVARIVNDLPEEADPPEVAKVDANTRAIMWLNLSSESLSRIELSDYADRFIADRFAAIDGIARVQIGGPSYAMRVWLDADDLASRGLTVSDVEQALRRENVDLPAGRLEAPDRYFTARITRPYQSREDFLNLTLDQGANGYVVKLRDVAEVEVSAEELREETRTNGKITVGLGMVTQSTANTLEVARQVKELIPKVRATLPEGIDLFLNYDTSLFIEEAVEQVYLSLGAAALLVVVVIFLFLGSARAALIPAATVPVSLVATVFFLYAMGYSLNLLTLLALVLSIGLVVDDAIVVLENVYRRLSMGESPRLAAMRGTRQVGFAVIATTLVLAAVFVPIGLIDGNVGRLFSEFAFTMAAAVGFSTLVALTLSPMMCSFLLRRGQGEGRFSRWVQGGLGRVAGAYRGVLARSIDKPMWLGVVLGVAAMTIVYFGNRTPGEFAPTEDRGAFFVLMRAPEGASFEYSRRYMHAIEDRLLKLKENGEAKAILIRTPGSFGDPSSFNSGFSIVNLVPWEQRERSTQQVMGEVAGIVSKMPGVLSFPVARSGLSRRIEEPVQFVLGGTDYAQLSKWRDTVIAAANENPGLVNVDSDFKETRPQVRVTVDRDRAADLGVPVEAVGRSLETLFGSRRVTTYVDRGKEHDVILQAREEDRNRPDNLNRIYVRSTQTGELIPLSNLVRFDEQADSASLNRFNRLRAITITANLAEGYRLGEALEFLQQTVAEELPPSAQIDYKGESREYTESRADIFLLFGFSLLVAYLVLAAQFESFIHPLIIMTTVPLALGGGLIGLYASGATLNIFSQIGFVMLVGLAAKNGILIVEFTNQLRDQGLAVREAILRAAELRFRPVAMTAVSTCVGALPLVLASGAGAESRFAIGIVVFSGVIFASVQTLFVIPWMYHLIGRFGGSPLKRTQSIEREDRDVVFAE